jgi:hypothetical protein
MSLVSPSPLGIPVPIIGITGEIYTGKTILALSLAPGKHPEGHPFAGKPRTLYLDFEQSGASYAGAGAERVDAPTEIRKGLLPSAVPTPINVFNWFRQKISSIPANQYDVIVVDPITDVEDGLVDYVRTHPGEFGYTSDQFSSASGLMWGAVKNFWKLLLLDLSARTHIFCFISHMRMEFVGGRPTKKLIPKGKETLTEIAALYLQLERDQSHDGEKPNPPSANLLKERLCEPRINDKTGELEVIKMLPPRLPVCTARALKMYIEKPIGSRKLKPEEILRTQEMSEDDRKILELEIKQSEERAAAHRLELWQQQQAANAMAAMGQKPTPPPPPLAAPTPAPTPPLASPAPGVAGPPPASPSVAGVSPANEAGNRVAEFQPPTPGRSNCSIQQIEEIRDLGRELHGSKEAFGAAFLEKFKAKGYTNLTALDELEGMSYIAELKRLLAQKHVNEKLAKAPPEPTPEEAAAQAPPLSSNAAQPWDIEPFAAAEPMTEQQSEILKGLIERKEMSQAEQVAFATHFKVTRLRELNQGQWSEMMQRRHERLSATQPTAS